MTLPDIPVLYVESETGIPGAPDAFARLEAKLPDMKGRKFYGTYQPSDDVYRACVSLEPGDDPAALGLATWTIPGGEYARDTMHDWQQKIPEIGPAFQRMAEEHEADPSRPSIELYRSDKELVLYLPVK